MNRTTFELKRAEELKIDTTSKKSAVEGLVSCAAMVRIYLEENGYEGLCSPGNECGCKLDDLMPCDGEYAMECEAGHKIDCPDTCGEGCDFHIVAGIKEENS